MQNRWDAGQVGFGTGGMQETRDAGEVGFRPWDAGQVGSRAWDAGQVGCRTRGIQDRRDAVKEGYRTGGMHDRWFAGQVGCRKIVRPETGKERGRKRRI